MSTETYVCDNMATDIYLRQHICTTDMAEETHIHQERQTQKKCQKGHLYTSINRKHIFRHICIVIMTKETRIHA